ncbi:MAG: DNA primase, partial [Dolichospermum sp.]
MQIPRLHPDTIEEVKLRADIVDVISEYVVLRKRGKDFVGLCPFHDEKTPSFTVSPYKQMYYCFGCQAAGNAIKFVMDLGKRQFAEVVLDLAKRYQVPVKTLEPEQRQELQRQISLRDQLYTVLASAAQFYQHTLRQSQGQKAREYLTKIRQFQEETIQQFGLGYAPPGWETLYRYLVESKHYPLQLVEQAGLIKPRKEGGGYYDVFRDRLMIPIRDLQGRVIAFGGRTLTEEQPKYLNSPETELFSKGKTLFALDAAKDAISKVDQAVVVEGYFDVISLHAAGINNAVASLGTALSIEQVRLLLRYTESKQLILNFDADKAGINATEKAIGEIANLAYTGEVQLKILNLPHSKDADEYLHDHTAFDYQQLLTNAPLWLDWQIHNIIKNRDLKQATDFQQVTQQIIKLLQNIVNSDILNYYVSYCAEILSLGDSRLKPLRIENLLTQIKPNSLKSLSPRINKPQPQ